MHPSLVAIGGLSISSFGFFLTLAFLTAVFIIWRLCRVYDINEEQTLDITLLTFFGGLIGARLFFVATNLYVFDSLSKMVLLNKYPGLNFWGGILFGLLALKLLVKRFHLHFWQIADFVTVGFFMSLILGSFGCLLGSCQYGIASNFPLSVTQVGVLGSRFPTQLLSSVIYFLAFLYLWRICLRFHWSGKVTALGFLILGVVKFFSDYLRGDVVIIYKTITVNQALGVVCFLFGFAIIYTQGRRSAVEDLKFIGNLFSDARVRKVTLLKIRRSWYNLRVNWKIALIRSRKSLLSNTRSTLRNLNVKQNPPQFHQD